MNRLGVFSLVTLGSVIAAGGASYIMQQKGPGKAAKGKHHKKHGHHAHEAPHHRHAKHGKKMSLPASIFNPVAITTGMGAALMATILWQPCACAPGQTAVAAGTPGALPPPAAGTTTTVPSTSLSNFGPR